MINLMFITNRPQIAQIAEEAGVNWIFIDMEFIGKDIRQGGLDTVKNHHTIEDIANIKAALHKAKILVRINPIHDSLPDYPSSEEEIDKAINAGADIVMLPFFKTIKEVKTFINYVGGRAKTCLLLETPEAAAILKDIVEIPGIDMIHIGLNDMHLALKMKFMFQLLADGSVDKWVGIIKSKGIQFGFGGLASLDGGAVPGRMILKEHYRLGSKMVIVSRAFCNTDKITDLDEIRSIFQHGITEIRNLERELANNSYNDFIENHNEVSKTIFNIINS